VDVAGAARRAKARVIQRFLAQAYLEGTETDAQGDWCVLDIDGVLETDVLGFPASSPLGMLALRALRAHGYRVLLATGRPLQDLEDRCAAYGLSGGVAEYGCVSYDAPTGDVHVHVPSGSRYPGSEILVGRLSEDPAVWVDPLYRWAVRASVGRGAGRTALPRETVRTLLADRAIHDCFYVVQGEAQTDFVPRGADKVRGVRGLFDRIGEGSSVPVLAVGDGIADVRLTRWAERGFAPRNAERAVAAAGVPVLRGAYQAGLAEAVGRLVGHRPGGCPACGPPRLDAETRALAALLAVPEAGRSGAPMRIADLAVETFRLTSSKRARTGRFAGIGAP
jgi:hydroxymethylpyrimidine pyrophosphatase-like HAD family hydrolase